MACFLCGDPMCQGDLFDLICDLAEERKTSLEGQVMSQSWEKNSVGRQYRENID